MKWKYVIDLIAENKIDEVIRYSNEITSIEYEVLEQHLISELENTKNNCIRNTIALVLSDLKSDKSIDTMISLINNMEYSHCRGTLIYALQTLNCQEQVATLFHFIFDGNYETKCNMFTLLESKLHLMSNQDIEFCKNSLQKRIEDMEWDLELLYDVSDNIFKMKFDETVLPDF